LAKANNHTPEKYDELLLAYLKKQILLPRKSRDRITVPAFRHSYQPSRKQRRPYGPECQPGGQLNIGRHPP
jgi:hypothetical protein